MNIREQNIKTYLKAPTWKQIDRKRKKHRIRSVSRFATIFEIPYDILRHVKMGDKELPAKYWHIIFEDSIIPTRKEPVLHNKIVSKSVNLFEDRKVSQILTESIKNKESLIEPINTQTENPPVESSTINKLSNKLD